MNLEKYFQYNSSSLFLNKYKRLFSKKIFKILKSFEEGMVLDFGCGTGDFIKDMYSVNPNMSYYALDKTDVLNNKGEKGLNINFVEMTYSKGSQLPFKNDFFDLITLVDVIEHIDVGTLDSLLVELHRILKRGGYIYIKTPDVNYLKRGYFFDDPTHIRPYNKISLIRLIQTHDFNLVAIYKKEKYHFVTFLPMLILSIFRRKYSLYWKDFLFGFSNYVICQKEK